MEIFRQTPTIPEHLQRVSGVYGAFEYTVLIKKGLLADYRKQLCGTPLHILVTTDIMCRISSGTTSGVAPTLLLQLGPAQCNMVGGEATEEQHPVTPIRLGSVQCCTGGACRFSVGGSRVEL